MKSYDYFYDLGMIVETLFSKGLAENLNHLLNIHDVMNFLFFF